MKNKKLKEIYNSYISYCNNNDRAFYIKDNFINFIKDTKLGYNEYEIDNLFNRLLVLAKSDASRLLPASSNSNDQITITRRKRHPRRDWGAKKVGVPAAGVAVGSAITYGAIMAANIIAGQGLLIPVTANTAMNIISTASVGLMGGILLTPAIIAAKNAITKKHYSMHYGNVKKILKKYDKDLNKALKKAKTQEAKDKILDSHTPAMRYQHLTTELNKKLAKLEAKISKSNERVLSLRNGGIITAPFRALARTVINVVNRNRIHHVQKCANDLMKEFNSVSNDRSMPILTKNLSRNIIYSSLENISHFVNDEISKSKSYALNNKKDKNLIENIDIYANMGIELQGIERPRRLKKRIEQIDTVAKDLFYGKTTILGTKPSNLSDEQQYLPTIDLKVEDQHNPSTELESTIDDNIDNNSATNAQSSNNAHNTPISQTKVEDHKSNTPASDTEQYILDLLNEYREDHKKYPRNPRSIALINKTIAEINKERGLNIPYIDTNEDDASVNETQAGSQVSFFDNIEDEQHSESDDIKIDTTTPPHYEEDEEESKSANSSPIATKTPAVETKTKPKEEPKVEKLVVKVGAKYSVKVDESLKTQINVSCNGKKIIIKKFKMVNGLSVPKNSDELKAEKAQAIIDVIA
ncbi:MAG: hypothetical protein IKC49_03835 [Clostridia bacterium]|nr:hypothetical protein [Clostridia bacterium]